MTLRARLATVERERDEAKARVLALEGEVCCLECSVVESSEGWMCAGCQAKRELELVAQLDAATVAMSAMREALEVAVETLRVHGLAIEPACDPNYLPPTTSGELFLKAAKELIDLAISNPLYQISHPYIAVALEQAIAARREERAERKNSE